MTFYLPRELYNWYDKQAIDTLYKINLHLNHFEWRINANKECCVEKRFTGLKLFFYMKNLNEN